MIYPDKRKWHYKLLSAYVNRILSRDFTKIQIIGKFPHNEKSVLIIGNHSTWWDGFWALYLNNKKLHKNFYVLMLEKELARRKFFTRVGAFSINPEARKVKEPLLFTRKLLEASNNMVLFFPEGKFSPATQNYKLFNRGVSFLYHETVKFNTLFIAYVTDYFQYRKPILNIYVLEANLNQNCSSQEIEKAYNNFYAQCLDQQKIFVP